MTTGQNMNNASFQRALIQRVAAFLAAHDAQAYLVGGPVRDMLLGRPAHDLDFVVTRGDSLTLAQALADEWGAPFVPLDRVFGIGRVVIRNVECGMRNAKPQSATRTLRAHSAIYLDFNRLRAPTLAEDLAARDFTINAIAAALTWAEDPSPEHLVDPLGGQHDLARRVVRAVSNHAFLDDPVRLLRAVRQAGELGFAIEPETLALIRRDADLIAWSASERVRDELVRLFAQPQAIAGVELLDELGLLTSVIPELEPARGMTQPAAHQWDVFQHVLETVRALEWLLDRLRGREIPWRWDPTLTLNPDQLHVDRVLAHLEAPSSAAGTRAVLLKFATLLHDIAKPQCRTIDAAGRIRFFNHETEGAPMAATVMRRLRFSAHEAETVAHIVAHHMRPAQLATARQVSSRAIARFLRSVGEAAIDVLLLSLCDHLSTQGPRVRPAEWNRHVTATGEMLAAYFHRSDRVAQLPRLLTGHDLMTTFGLEPGKQVGTLLDALREAQLAGTITTRQEALAWVAERLGEGEA